MCYTCIKDVNERNALFFGFFGIENFRSKLEFAQRMLTAAYRQNASVKEIPQVFDRVKKSSFKRNKLVHRRSFYYALGKPGRRYVLEEWPKAYETPAERRRALMSPPSKAFGVRDISAIRLEFVAVYASLERLKAKLLGTPTRLQECDEQPKRPLGIQTLARQIRGALEPPSKSPR